VNLDTGGLTKTKGLVIALGLKTEHSRKEIMIHLEVLHGNICNEIVRD